MMSPDADSVRIPPSARRMRSALGMMPSVSSVLVDCAHSWRGRIAPRDLCQSVLSPSLEGMLAGLGSRSGPWGCGCDGGDSTRGTRSLDTLHMRELSRVAEESHHRRVDEESHTIPETVGVAEPAMDRCVWSSWVTERHGRLFEREFRTYHFPDPNHVEPRCDVVASQRIDAKGRRVGRIGVMKEVVSVPLPVHAAEKKNEMGVEPHLIRSFAATRFEDLWIRRCSLVAIAENVDPGRGARCALADRDEPPKAREPPGSIVRFGDCFLSDSVVSALLPVVQETHPTGIVSLERPGGGGAEVVWLPDEAVHHRDDGGRADGISPHGLRDEGGRGVEAAKVVADHAVHESTNFGWGVRGFGRDGHHLRPALGALTRK